MNISYSEFMGNLKVAWNYKYHNTPFNIVEPYPIDLKPSEIVKELNIKSLCDNQSILLDYADIIYSNSKLYNCKPYNITLNFNNPKPFTLTVYSKNIKSAKAKAIKEFSKYLYSSNSSMYQINKIQYALSTGQVTIKITEI